MRSTSVFTKKPTSLSSASSVRPAIGVPSGMSVPAPSRDSSVASAVWSTMNRLDLPSRATRTRPLYTSSGSSKVTRSPTIRCRGRPRAVERQRKLLPADPTTSASSSPVGGRPRCRGRPRSRGRPAARCCSRRTAPAAAPTAGQHPARGPRTPPSDPGRGGPIDQASPAMWWTTASRTYSSSPSSNRKARRGGSSLSSKGARDARSTSWCRCSSSVAVTVRDTSAVSRTIWYGPSASSANTVRRLSCRSTTSANASRSASWSSVPVIRRATGRL
ncbi:hypothetical protein SVIOM342S_00374 [Streptomyces violaceorubidus]